MRKKGFTLIELLAVIIILAVVALIATPIVLDVIDDARISAGRSEANMILGGINNYCASEEMKAQLDSNYTRICTSDMDKDDVPTMVNLGNATIDKIVYNGDKLTELEITSNNHKFTLCPSGTFAMDDEECEGNNGDVALEGVSIKSVAESLVYENGVCKQEGTYQYMGGCYIKSNVIEEPNHYGMGGISEHPTTNYIWYSGFLWRIMGINADGTVRMITEDNVTSIPWGASDTAENWDGSYAKDWLNNYFYSRLKGNNIIKEQTWCSETTTDSSSERTTCTNNLSTEPARVGLLTLDEYNLAGGIGSYLNIRQYQWTMTPSSSSDAWHGNYFGSALTNSVSVSDTTGLRAVINVNSDVTITAGNGTLGTSWSSETGPYILNEDKNVEVTGKLNDKAVSGEYVLFAGKKYRVVDKDNNGNTKLILDGYYEETSGTPYDMSYGSNNTFSTTTGIGQKLNVDVLNWLVQESDTTNRNKLVSNYTWYQNDFGPGSGYDYKISLNEENPTRSIQATVGLIRIGEMLSSQSSSILTKGYTTTSSYNNASSYWTITTYGSSNAWPVYRDGTAGYSGVSNTKGLRPVIVVNSDVTITAGNGTWSNPYQI